MRTVRKVTDKHNKNYNILPDGGIVNQTDTVIGTPAVEEVYGDVLYNIYAVLRSVGIEPNEKQDNQQNGYQLIEALKRLPNEINDDEKLIELTGRVWSVNLDLEFLPNKFVFIGRATEDYNFSQSYRFKGIKDAEYGFKSVNGFKTGDSVLVVVDREGVRAVGLNGSDSNTTDTVNYLQANPINYNDSSQVYMINKGSLFSDLPSFFPIQNSIQVFSGSGQTDVLNMFVIKGYLLCYCLDWENLTYNFYQLSFNDLTKVENVTVSNKTIPTGIDNSPYCFTDGDKVYITNDSGNTANDYELNSFVYDPDTKRLTFSGALNLDNSFKKTTNTVIKNNELITLIKGQVSKYSLSTGNNTDLGQLTSNNGLLFCFNNNIYFGVNGIAKPWVLT